MLVLRPKFDHGKDADGSQAKHEDFTQCIELSEVNQDHVHNVFAEGQFRAVFDVVAGNAFKELYIHCSQNQQGHHYARENGHRQVPIAFQWGRKVDERRQFEEHQHQKNYGQGLHQQLGNTQVRGAEVDEDEGDAKASDPNGGN